MTHRQAEEAARNNAIWCDTICRVHGTPGEFRNELWLNRHQVPRLHPNAVTLSSQEGMAAQLASIWELGAAGLSGPWSVKDSFCSLDLAALGFEPLFDAMWLWRAPFQPLPGRAASGLQWSWARSTPELAKWETAWSGNPVNRATVQTRVFLPALLAHLNIVFILGYRDQEVVAGAIAHHASGVVGMSNVFVPPDDPAASWADCVAIAQEHFPGSPIVGYEHGPTLAIAQEIGFEVMQPLRIWVFQS